MTPMTEDLLCYERGFLVQYKTAKMVKKQQSLRRSEMIIYPSSIPTWSIITCVLISTIVYEKEVIKRTIFWLRSRCYNLRSRCYNLERLQVVTSHRILFRLFDWLNFKLNFSNHNIFSQKYFRCNARQKCGAQRLIWNCL